ncbi:DNA glycosylase [Dunaliella salina]|uniref:DNA glycosylase n=1 Tax=Dunaliella salina TaxID=3046 RepID=A0ABQ7GIA9_DUNSA|nr:DNA glycosylase [Dunaliella salina]|eukprot:KAF5834342.1 DNA glycosylase [Dunaliella salina]
MKRNARHNANTRTRQHPTTHVSTELRAEPSSMDPTQTQRNGTEDLDSKVMENIEHLQQAVSHLCNVDEKLAALIAKHSSELPVRLLSRPSETCFQACCKSIIFQQLSMKAASTIYSRFLSLCGVLPPSAAHTQALVTPGKRKADEGLETAAPESAAASSSRKQQVTEGRQTRRSAQRSKGAVDGDHAVFLATPKQQQQQQQQQQLEVPVAADARAQGGSSHSDGEVPRPLEPSDVLGCSMEALRGCGLSNQKASYLTGIATAFAAAGAAASRGEQATLQDSVLRALPERELTAALVQLKGVGQWTADMVCMFTLGKANVLPTGDLGVRKALYSLPSLPSPAKMLEIADKWQPWRSVGSWYLWKMAPGGVW